MSVNKAHARALMEDETRTARLAKQQAGGGKGDIQEGVFGVMVNYGSFDLRDAQGFPIGAPPAVGMGNSVALPAGVMRPIWSALFSANQRFPSGPAVIKAGCE